MDDVQINVNDLMTAFATENATLAQRAVIAEQKVKAYSNALERANAELEAHRRAAAMPQPGSEEPIEIVPEPAVEAVKGRTRPARKS